MYFQHLMNISITNFFKHYQYKEILKYVRTLFSLYLLVK